VFVTEILFVFILEVVVILKELLILQETFPKKLLTVIFLLFAVAVLALTTIINKLFEVAVLTATRSDTLRC
jgi:hypothetical protein